MSMDAASGARTAPRDAEPPLSARVGSLRQHAEGVRRRELDRALSRLEAESDLTEARVEAIEALSDALIDRLLEAPVRRLEAAAGAGDRETVETGVGLFVEE